MGTAHRWEGLLPRQEPHGLGDDETEERSHDRDFGSCNKNSLGGLTSANAVTYQDGSKTQNVTQVHWWEILC